MRVYWKWCISYINQYKIETTPEIVFGQRKESEICEKVE